MRSGRFTESQTLRVSDGRIHGDRGVFIVMIVRKGFGSCEAEQGGEDAGQQSRMGTVA